MTNSQYSKTWALNILSLYLESTSELHNVISNLRNNKIMLWKYSLNHKKLTEHTFSVN